MKKKSKSKCAICREPVLKGILYCDTCNQRHAIIYNEICQGAWQEAMTKLIIERGVD